MVGQDQPERLDQRAEPLGRQQEPVGADHRAHARVGRAGGLALAERRRALGDEGDVGEVLHPERVELGRRVHDHPRGLGERRAHALTGSSHPASRDGACCAGVTATTRPRTRRSRSTAASVSQVSSPGWCSISRMSGSAGRHRGRDVGRIRGVARGPARHHAGLWRRCAGPTGSWWRPRPPPARPTGSGCIRRCRSARPRR